MSLQAQLAPLDLLNQHAEACDVPLCPLCQALWEREYEADNAKRLEVEAEQDIELDDYEKAEVQRDQEPDDDWNPNDEIYPSRG